MNALSFREKSILRSIVEHCISIKERIARFNITQEVFRDDADYREMLLFPLVQIGELANHLDDSFIDAHSEVPWRSIVGLRHIIVHGYGTLDIEWVWSTISCDIDSLRATCENILSKGNQESFSKTEQASI